MSVSDRQLLSRRQVLVRAGRLSAAIGGLAAGAAIPGATSASKLPAPIFHGSRATRRIALTVDDGWGPDKVRRILDLLEHDHVKATFMPYARAMHLDEPLWRRISDAGFPIANHTNSHPFMTRLSATQQHFEITNARHTAEQITGRPVARIFRPPYGDYNATTLGVARDAGFPTVVLWDTTDLDTTGTKSTSLMTAAAERGINGSILLVHGGPSLTPVVLPAVIANYRARGFTFVTLPELLGLPTRG